MQELCRTEPGIGGAGEACAWWLGKARHSMTEFLMHILQYGNLSRVGFVEERMREIGTERTDLRYV